MRGLLLILFAVPVWAQDPSHLAERFDRQEQIAFRHFEAKDWAKAIAAFEEQIAIYARNPRPYYNIACCHALQGDARAAATWLRLAVSHGFDEYEHAQEDSDLDKVRSDEGFLAAMAALERARNARPALLPKPLAAHIVPASGSARAIMMAGELRRQVLAVQATLLTEHQHRLRAFGLLDRELGELTRYLVENGDARDGALAAHARIAVAAQYLALAQPNEPGLRRAAAQLVLDTTSEFLRGWAGSRFLPSALLQRGSALEVLGARKEALHLWGALVADHPGTDAAALAAKAVEQG